MGLSTLHHVRFAGMASCVPKRILHNIDDAAPKIRSERERLVRNIGIHQRRICQEWQTFSDLAFDATEQLLASLEWKREEVDALIVVTQSPDYLIPATAIILQDRLGLSHATIAFDVNLGCSGYTFGLHILGSMIAAGAVKKGLVLVGDRCATIKDPLFSDAGTATALEYDAAGGHREPFGPQHSVPTREPDGTLHWPSELILDGPAVLSFSTQRIPPTVRQALEYAKLSVEDVDYFIFHQANRMINETIRKKLALPLEKVPSTLHDFGNTSGASLPVTITARIHEQLGQGRHKLLLGGFGIGLSWGICILDIEGAKFPPLLIA
jgi:3-oxoacyl-[acyl-carrier-protein] synthase-3